MLAKTYHVILVRQQTGSILQFDYDVPAACCYNGTTNSIAAMSEVWDSLLESYPGWYVIQATLKTR